jgi:hypothetical protein
MTAYLARARSDPRFNAETFAALQAWRDSSGLEDLSRQFCTDDTLMRYHLARDGDFEASRHMLMQSIEWRRIHCADAPKCDSCASDFKSHCFFPIGWTSDGWPIIYSCVPRAACYKVDETVNHVVQTLEKSFAHTQSSDKWLWLVDFNGFGLSHAMHTKLGIGFARTFSAHFPERLGRLVLINPPRVFDLLLGAVRPFCD